MNTSYLNTQSKTELESYINNLDTLKDTPKYNYQPAYIKNTGSANMELIDARARLGTVEAKEYLDDFENRLNNLDSLLNSSSSTGSPTKKIVPVGKQLSVGNIGSAYMCLAGEPVGNGNLYAIATGSGFGLSVSYDGGKTFIIPNIEDLTFNGINLEDENSDADRMFRYAEIDYIGTEFIFILKRFSSTGVVLRSSDLIHFDLVTAPIDVSYYSFILKNDNDIIVIDTGNNVALKYIDGALTLLGGTNYTFEANYAYKDTRYKKFNGKIYFKNNQNLAIMSDDYLSATDVVYNDGLSIQSAFNIDIQNGNLIVSDDFHALYTTDGETWHMVGHIYPDNYRQKTFCGGGMRILYDETDKVYYSKLYFNGEPNNGIYYWENLDDTPTAITVSGMDFYEENEHPSIKKVNGKVYFIYDDNALYMMNNRKFEKILDLRLTTSNFTTTGDINSGRAASSLILASVNGYRIIGSPSGSGIARDNDTYILEDYTASGDETDTIVATF